MRVIVGAEKVTDKEAESLSFEIARKIQNEMTYPGSDKNYCYPRNTGQLIMQNNDYTIKVGHLN